MESGAFERSQPGIGGFTSGIHFIGKTRREFVSGLSLAAMAVSGVAAAPQGPIIRLIPGPEVDNYKKAQAHSLSKFRVSAQSRYVQIPKLSLTAHVLEAGHDDPVVFIHGGAATAVQFAPMLGALQSEFHTFAPDRPGCGLTDKIDYVSGPQVAPAGSALVGFFWRFGPRAA
jgi:pimeloyl-ACP methyl ester carboxylesterase